MIKKENERNEEEIKEERTRNEMNGKFQYINFFYAKI